MFHKAPLKRHKDSSKGWNTRIVISAISIIITVVVYIELHIRRLISHSVLPW